MLKITTVAITNKDIEVLNNIANIIVKNNLDVDNEKIENELISFKKIIDDFQIELDSNKK
jgi:predicted nucleotidyltransferase